MHEFESVNINLAFASATDFGQLLLDTTVMTERNASGVKFKDLLQ
jgi:hypothetical protein